MAERFFVRMIGTDYNGDSELMTEQEAKDLLREKYRYLISELHSSYRFDDMYIEPDLSEFELRGEEYYQTMYILPENTLQCGERLVEEIERELIRTNVYMLAYEYELTESGVYECTERIHELLNELRRYIPNNDSWMPEDQEVAPTPIGRIDYLAPNGDVIESVEYVDAESFRNKIEDELYCGVPLVIVRYCDENRRVRFSLDFIEDLGTLPAGSRIEYAPGLQRAPSATCPRSKILISSVST